MLVTEYMKDNLLFLDGGMGTLLQERGLKPGELPEWWNLQKPDIITDSLSYTASPTASSYVVIWKRAPSIGA